MRLMSKYPWVHLERSLPQMGKLLSMQIIIPFPVKLAKPLPTPWLNTFVGKKIATE